MRIPVIKTENKKGKARMKANNGKGNNPLRDEWETPSEIFDPLMKQYNFNFDCCADNVNTKLENYTEAFEDVTQCDNHIVCWMNPPFSIAWRMFEHFFKIVKKGVAIYRCDNLETALWQKVILPNCSWVFIPNKRVCYEGLDGDGARFPSALIGVGLDIPKGLKGIVLKVINNEKRL